MQKVWVLAEKPIALAQLCAGARQLGQQVSAIVAGSRDDAEKAVRLGADQVYWLERSDDDMIENYIETMLKLLKDERPDLLMIQPSKRGKLIAGRLAAGLGTSVLVDATEVGAAGNTAEISHMVYGGAAFRRETTLSSTAIVTVGAGVFAAGAEDAGREGAIIAVDFIQPAYTIKRLEKKTKGSSEVNLNVAKRVVGIGRGIGSQEDIRIAEAFAGAIGAEIGCSRPLAEGVNWLPRERYIGVSGAMLKPDVYFAVGISGQVQHMVGVNQAKIIVAINKDKTAPIFQQADYGIVGDLYTVLPALTQKFKLE